MSGVWGVYMIVFVNSELYNLSVGTGARSIMINMIITYI